MKVTIDGQTHEIEPSNLELDEGYALITPDNVPDGYYTKDAMEAKIQDRIKSAKTNKEQELIDNPAFHKKVFNKYGVLLDDEGKPKGLKPEVDIDEIKKQTAQQISEQYEDDLKNLKTELEKRNEAVIESAIMEAASGNYKEDWTKSFDDGKPLVVKHFKDRIGVDDNGQPYVKDSNGEKMYKGDGLMRPKDYLLDDKRFGELMKDKRQRGSGFNRPGESPINGYNADDIKGMKDEEYEKERENIFKALKDNKVK